MIPPDSRDSLSTVCADNLSIGESGALNSQRINRIVDWDLSMKKRGRRKAEKLT